MIYSSKPLLAFLIVIAILLTPIAIGSSIDGAAAKKQKRLLIIFDENTAPEKQKEIIAAVGGKVRKDFQPLMKAVSIAVDGEAATAQAISEIKQRFKEVIEFVEEDRKVHSLHHDYEHYNNNDDDDDKEEYRNFGAWSIAHIGSHIAHQQGVKGAGVRVAVLDSGVDYSHPDIAANYAGGYNFVSLTPDPFDDAGHGTFAAGIIAADDDGSGIVGIAPDSQIYAIKVLDSSGTGYLSDIIAALRWCIDSQVDIASMSFGLAYDSPALRNAVASAYSSGMLLIAAAGNTGGAIEYPAAYDQVVAVGATDAGDARAEFSAAGADLELVAPGVNVVSTYPLLATGPYGTDTGTSTSAPHVAGVAALIKSTDERLWYPNANGDGVWTAAEIRSVLAAAAQDLGAHGIDPQYGYGRVDAADAVRTSSAIGSGGGGSSGSGGSVIVSSLSIQRLLS